MIKNKVNNKKSSSKKEIQKFLLKEVVAFCDKCGSKYKTEDIKIIQHNKLATIIHLSCHSCKTSNIISMLHPVGVTNRSPIYSDLSVPEIADFLNIPPISVEDILFIHSELVTQEGRLFI